MNQLYIGATYLFDSEKVYDPQVVCVETNFDDVYNYLAKIRHLNVIESEYDHEGIDALPQNCDVFATITKMTFATEEQCYQFLIQDDIQPFIMHEFGKIDRGVAKMGKKAAKNVKVPHIIEDIISDEIGTFAAESKVAAHTLKQLLYYLNGYDKTTIKTSMISRALVTCIDFLTRIAATHGMEIQDDMYQRHHILFCGEREYRAIIKRYLEMTKLDAQYREKLYEE